MLRTLLRALTVAAFFATLLVPATPAAAAAETSYTLSSNAVTITRSGQQYQMTIMANTYGSGEEAGESMTVTISKVSNPDGVAWARQQQAYSWFFNGDRFIPTSTLASATLKTSAEMGDYGNVALTFAQNGPVQEYCNGTLRQRPGTLSGSVTLNTGTSLFGQIRAVPTKATLTSNSGSNCYAPGHPTNACPAPGLSVNGYRFPGGSAYSSVGGTLPADPTAPATLFFQSSAPLPAAKTNADGYLGRMVTTRAPRADVSIASGLATATLQGEPGTWVSGTATFTSNAAASTGTPYPCAGGKESVNTYRSGTMSGGLAADTFTGPDIAVGQNMISGATRTIVRPR